MLANMDFFDEYKKYGTETMSRFFELNPPCYYADGRFLCKLSDRILLHNIRDKEHRAQLRQWMENDLVMVNTQDTNENEDEESVKDVIIEQSEDEIDMEEDIDQEDDMDPYEEYGPDEDADDEEDGDDEEDEKEEK